MIVTVVCCVNDDPTKTVRLCAFSVSDAGMSYRIRLTHDGTAGEVLTSDNPAHCHATMIDRRTDEPLRSVREVANTPRDAIRSTYTIDCPRCERVVVVRAERLRAYLKIAARAVVSQVPLSGLDE